MIPSLPKIVPVVFVIVAASVASSQGALLYEFTFENGSNQTLANTGTVGGVATNGQIGSGYTGTYTSSIPPTADNVWAYDLPSNGINGSMLNLPDATQLRLTDPTAQMTVAMWVNLALDTQRVDGLAGNQASQNGGSGWSFSVNNTTNKLQFSIHNPSAVAYPLTRTYSGSATLTANTWTHVAVVYQNNAPSFYIDGVFVGAGGNFGGNGAAANTGAVRIGSGLADSLPIDGMVDNVMFYDTALNASQIAALAATIPEPGVAGTVLGGCALLALFRRTRR